MNALSILYVNAHLQDLLDEAAKQHKGRVHGPSLFQRIASIASDAMSRLAMPLDNRGWMFPAVDQSPNRS